MHEITVTVRGPERSGRSTLAALFADALSEHGIEGDNLDYDRIVLTSNHIAAVAQQVRVTIKVETTHTEPAKEST